jgi:hypothetical protein
MIFETPPATPEAHGVAAHLHRSPRDLHSEVTFVHKTNILMHKSDIILHRDNEPNEMEWRQYHLLSAF